PTVTFKVKDKNKFKKVTEEISKKRDNVMVVWLDFKKGDSYKKGLRKVNDLNNEIDQLIESSTNFLQNMLLDNGKYIYGYFP
ncbi:hypothetical protein P7996_16080, partial [Staphylococcus aureus]|nr:hypothetical protein [Staphylococcus aureus]